MNRVKRIEQLYTFFKKESNNKLISIIMNKSNRDFDNYIVPLVNQYCPEIKKTAFYLKLRLGSASLYALGAYMMLFISGKKFNKYRFVSKLFNLNEKSFLAVLNLISISKKMRKQIIFAAAFNTLIDHVFDGELNSFSPKQRSTIIKDAINGSPINSNQLKLLSYLASNLHSKKIKYFEKWCDTEARSIITKTSQRDCGVKATMDLLYSTINKNVSKKNIDLMYGVGYLVQMIDDYIDLEDDINQNKITPVIEKKWDYKTIIDQYYICEKLLSQISKDNNISGKLIPLVLDNLMSIGYFLVFNMDNKNAN
jgi:hypothetical protein